LVDAFWRRWQKTGLAVGPPAVGDEARSRFMVAEALGAPLTEVFQFGGKDKQ